VSTAYRIEPVQTTASRFSQPTGEIDMKWETPAAIDVRYGFEITMYFAHR
jgi:coenzyme PQQ precursor peptide PqqA